MYKISHSLLIVLSLFTAFQCMVIEPNPDNSIPQFTSSNNDAHRRRHRRHRHGNRRHQRGRNVVTPRQREENDVDEGDEMLKDTQYMFSPRVVLSSHKPLLPPVDLLEPPEDYDDLALAAVSIGQNATEGDKGSGPTDRQDESQARNVRERSRRSLDFVHVPVCDSVSEWVERTEARNMWGHQVKVLQEIDVGGARVNQYFYETRCREEKSACVGIDTVQFYSVCKNKHVWAYAKIRTISGDEGWNLIKIPGSCNCALFRKKVKRLSLLDLLQDIR